MIAFEAFVSCFVGLHLAPAPKARVPTVRQTSFHLGLILLSFSLVRALCPWWFSCTQNMYIKSDPDGKRARTGAGGPSSYAAMQPYGRGPSVSSPA